MPRNFTSAAIAVLGFSLALASQSFAGVLWADGFETYPAGYFPGTPWQYTGNSNIRVDNSVACQATQSLGVHGTPGGCWEAIPCHPLGGANLPIGFEIEFCIMNGSNYMPGCHPWQGGLGMTTVCDWVTGMGVGILGTDYDRRMFGGRFGDLAPYEQDRWYHFRVRYVRINTDTVSMEYWIDGQWVAKQMGPAASYEDQLTAFNLSSGDGSVWYDDFVVSELVVIGVSSDSWGRIKAMYR
jgi:hypothetical protein